MAQDKWEIISDTETDDVGLDFSFVIGIDPVIPRAEFAGNSTEQFACAHKIIAAPDMLETLKDFSALASRIKSWYFKGNLEPMWYEDFEALAAKAEEVIAKAEPPQP